MKHSKQSKHSERKHSTVGASGSERWLNCPGSVKASEGLQGVETAAGERGTALHERLELLGRQYFIEGKRPKLKEDEQELWDLLQYVDRQATELGLNRKTDIIFERKVDLSFIDPDCFGTNDIALVELFGTLEIIDYKSGKKLVKAKDNTQLLYYAMGMANEFDWNFAKVKLTIAQPVKGELELDSWEIPISKLESYVPLFKKGVERTRDPKAKRFAGKWCDFCPALVFCVEAREKQLEKIQQDFSFEEPKALTVPKSVAPAFMGNYLEAAVVLETWIDAVRRKAEEMLKKGEKIPGWLMIPTRSKRTWKSEKGAALVAKKMGIKFYKENPIGISELEKKVGVKMFKERFDVFTHKKSTGKERLGRVRDVENDFDDLGDE